MSTQMNNQVRTALAKLMAQAGDSLLADPRRLRAALSDECPSFKREVSVLMAAVEHRIPAELQTKSSSQPWPTVAGRLVKRLVDDAGLSEAGALWAVETWALALGRIDASALTPHRDAIQPEPRRTPPGVHGANDEDEPLDRGQRRRPRAEPNPSQGGKGLLVVLLAVVGALLVCPLLGLFVFGYAFYFAATPAAAPVAPPPMPIAAEKPIKELPPPEPPVPGPFEEFGRQDKARKFFQAKQWDQAVAEYTGVIKDFPKSKFLWDYHLSRGHCYFNQNRHDEAIADYQKALQAYDGTVKSEKSTIQMHLGNAYREKNNFPAAIEQYNAALTGAFTFQRDYFAVHEGRAYCYFSLQDYNKAVEDYTQALRWAEIVNDRNLQAATYQNRALAYDRLKMPALAEQDRKRSRDLK